MIFLTNLKHFFYLEDYLTSCLSRGLETKDFFSVLLFLTEESDFLWSPENSFLTLLFPLFPPLGKSWFFSIHSQGAICAKLTMSLLQKLIFQDRLLLHKRIRMHYAIALCTVCNLSKWELIKERIINSRIYYESHFFVGVTLEKNAFWARSFVQ